jgi:hypothetical protein
MDNAQNHNNTYNITPIVTDFYFLPLLLVMLFIMTSILPSQKDFQFTVQSQKFKIC